MIIYNSQIRTHENSGGGRIRTFEAITGLLVFKTSPFNRSGTPPLFSSVFPALYLNLTDVRGIAICGFASLRQIGNKSVALNPCLPVYPPQEGRQDSATPPQLR